MVLRSITFKFLAFLGFAAVAAGVFLSLLFKVGSVPLPTVYGVLGAFLLLILLFFLWQIAAPLFRVVRQITLLLTGKKYHRIEPASADEIGLITHFFNKITLSLESISRDILEQKRLTSELDIARSIQKNILPSSAPGVVGLDIVARSRPAAEMGGDSFDFIRQGVQTMLYIGDVTGHGVPAGLIMMMVNTLIHAFAEHDMFPQEILTEVNKLLHSRISSQQFMTLVMLRWDEEKQEMHYVGAGHEYILIFRAAEKKVEKIRTGGVALRMTADIRAFIQEKSLPLADHDVIVLYSDGITEGKNEEGDMYTVERLAESLQRNGARANAARIFDSLTKDFSEFIGNYEQQNDDITMIVIKKLPPDEKVRTPIQLTIGGLEEVAVPKNEKKWEWE